MTERTTLEIIAPTVEEALAQGLAQLGLPADAVSVEVLDSGQQGPVRPGRTPGPRAPDRSRSRAMICQSRSPRPRRRLRPRPSRAGRNPGRRVPVRPLRHPLPRPSRRRSTGSSQRARQPALPEIHHDLNDPVLDKTEAMISKLLFLMGLQAQVSAHYGEAREDRRPIMVDIRGGDLGVLIGRRGETLDAFQYVASLMVGKEVGQFIHLVVDVEGHRDRRQRQLQQLARRMAEQVIKTGRKLTLEPMTASERRIIHMELRDHPAVTTQSAGEDPHRKITILPKD